YPIDRSDIERAGRVSCTRFAKTGARPFLFTECDPQRRVVAAEPMLASVIDVCIDDVPCELPRDERVVDTRRVEATRTTVEPGVFARRRMECAKDIDQVEPGDDLV